MDIKFQKNEPLKKHCSFRVGGNAKYFYVLKNIEEFPDLIKAARKLDVPFFIYGSGNNILFPDEGLNGLVIKMAANNLKITENDIEADSGVFLSQIESFGPLRTIPGTVGGAIRGNAGTLELSIADIIKKVLIYDPVTNKMKILTKTQLKMGYRESRFKKTSEIILKGFFKAPKVGKEAFIEAVSFRQEKQPYGLSAGSYFKNPLPEKAGQLIDKAGLKGRTIGGAQISEKHANFIINTGDAKTKDILDLSSLAKAEVKKQFGISLEEEIHVVSERDLIN